MRNTEQFWWQIQNVYNLSGQKYGEITEANCLVSGNLFDLCSLNHSCNFLLLDNFD